MVNFRPSKTAAAHIISPDFSEHRIPCSTSECTHLMKSTTSRKNGSGIDTSAPNLSVCKSEHDKEVTDQKVQQVGIVWHTASGTMQRLNNNNKNITSNETYCYSLEREPNGTREGSSLTRRAGGSGFREGKVEAKICTTRSPVSRFQFADFVSRTSVKVALSRVAAQRWTVLKH